jgi:5-oxoprolinase (ATP-hydrolysing)
LKKYNISIDTGGTFTDCIAVDEEGVFSRKKVLSSGVLRGEIVEILTKKSIRINQSWTLGKDILQGYNFHILGTKFTAKIEKFDFQKSIIFLVESLPKSTQLSVFEITANEEAPVLGIRMLTQTSLQDEFPKLNIRLGSTKGTNALLELKGVKTLFVVTEGFKDLIEIGNQARPDIFAQNIIKRTPLYHIVLEVKEQVDFTGKILFPLAVEDLGSSIQQLKSDGILSVAICLKNAYRNPIHEQELKDFFQQHFDFVSISTDLSQQIKFLNRAETTVVNAYLKPVIQNYLHNISSKLPDCQLDIMTSSGGLVNSQNFDPKDSLFSGPAGGLVGAVNIASRFNAKKIITFDMGGTSTDVARYDEKLDYGTVQTIGNAQIFSPALKIETVAAGGGSVCGFDGYKLFVGPESEGSKPGPACYGAGGRLTITDVNLLLGRLDTAQFSIPVYQEKAEEALQIILENINKNASKPANKFEVLEGFRTIANEKMTDAVRKISISEGYDPKDFSMVAFGGAGGLHACGVANLLGISQIILPADAGLLSAYGISTAVPEKLLDKTVLQILTEISWIELLNTFSAIQNQLTAKFSEEGFLEENLSVYRKSIFLRLKGQDSSIEIQVSDYQTVISDFKKQYLQIYGHFSAERAIEIESIRVIVRERDKQENLNVDLLNNSEIKPIPERYIKAFVSENEVEIPVFVRDKLLPKSRIEGFALLLDDFSTTVIEENYVAILQEDGTIILFENKTIESQSIEQQSFTELELFMNRFMAIAEDMGTMLQRTSLSVNVKERLDFSCALVDASGELIANAPHIPVHLGSLGVCVRKVLAKIPIQKGDVVITNHPKYGGSHLPDLTMISSVYSSDNQLIGYLVNRCHHAEIGGIRPASMPPDAKNLAEEGVVIPPMYLVKNGDLDWQPLIDLLRNSPYPSRSVDENIADLNAAMAANRSGEKSLLHLVNQFGLGKVHNYMDLLKKYSSERITKALTNFKNGDYFATEKLDDGTILQVKVALENGNCTIDFTGSSATHKGNLNANDAIVNSVVMYVLRVILQEKVPLNDGLLQNIKLVIPSASILNPNFSEDITLCPAVVGGNVELSQRLTDTLFKAFGIMACSQGTMNNLLFGNQNFGYYETICGGSGAGNGFDGASAVHTHMTNTRITDPEIFELRYPAKLRRFEIRKNSGGNGHFKGGDGIVREIVFEENVEVSILTQHRNVAPYGMNEGEGGAKGEQFVIKSTGEIIHLSHSEGISLQKGDRIVVKTPGGGGFGKLQLTVSN